MIELIQNGEKIWEGNSLEQPRLFIELKNIINEIKEENKDLRDGNKKT